MSLPCHDSLFAAAVVVVVVVCTGKYTTLALEVPVFAHIHFIYILRAFMCLQKRSTKLKVHWLLRSIHNLSFPCHHGFQQQTMAATAAQYVCHGYSPFEASGQATQVRIVLVWSDCIHYI